MRGVAALRRDMAGLTREAVQEAFPAVGQVWPRPVPGGAVFRVTSATTFSRENLIVDDKWKRS